MNVLQRYGILGKPLSKLFHESDMLTLKSAKAVAALRPRGILSGFLVITDSVVFVPPVMAKQQPFSVRMRLDPSLNDIVFSAYSENGDIVLEDVLVWQGKSLLGTGFEERWKYVGNFVTAWQPDGPLQGCTIRIAEYHPLAELQEPAERQVVEFVPLTPNTKRLVWIPVAEAAAKTVWIAKREHLIGPDVFSLWSSTGEKQGMALVRTLAVSKALRLHPVDEFRVNTTWNKLFERWEILDIA
jgi:hypothetical protein